MLRKGSIAIAFGVVCCVSAPARAAERGSSNWAPYEFLIGEWDVASESGGPPVAAARFRWGPNRSYVWYAGSLVLDGVERPHFEGLLLWNGVHRNLDMLLSMDLDGGLVQEQGTMHAEPDGTVVREITATYSEGSNPIGGSTVGLDGATASFRQTFKAVGPDRVLTSVLRRVEQRWTPTFPGSDHLVMTRKPKSRSTAPAP
jgi:hypothetical protein